MCYLRYKINWFTSIFANFKLVIIFQDIFEMTIFKFKVIKSLPFYTFCRNKYYPIKEEKQLFEAKQQELKRIEEAKRKSS